MKTTNKLRFSRRKFLISSSLLTAAIATRPWHLTAQTPSPVITMRQAAASAKITTHPVRGNVSMLEGAGGNIAVLAGRDGMLLVDAGITASRPALTDALARISPDPVKYLVNTHWHFDHTDGNEWLHSVGAEIIAHENTRKYLSKSTRVDAWNFTFPPSPEGALPAKVFQKKHTLRVNGEKLVLSHYQPSHTDSDISVEFSDADIFQTGDVWWNGHYPFIDYDTGGSINGMIAATERTLSIVGKKTLIIPGHGPVGGKIDLRTYRDMLVTVRDKVAALKKQGVTLEGVIATKPTANFDAKWGGFIINGATFTKLVYAGV